MSSPQQRSYQSLRSRVGGVLDDLERRPRTRRIVPAINRLTGRQPVNGSAPSPAPEDQDPSAVWWRQHYHNAADEVIEFLGGAGLTLEDQMVADIGCGDGIIDLALAIKGRPRQLVGYDINPTQVEPLLDQARRYEGVEAIPDNLSFTVSKPEYLDAPDAQFDAVITWSAFEHVRDPESLLREMRRILRPSGVLFLQLWPFYHSAQGSHLWDWFPGPFHHLNQDEAEIEAAMRSSDRHSQEWAEYMLSEFKTLNKITVDDLHEALVAAGFSVRQLELLSHRTSIPAGLDEYPLSVLGVAGVKLLATPV